MKTNKNATKTNRTPEYNESSKKWRLVQHLSDGSWFRLKGAFQTEEEAVAACTPATPTDTPETATVATEETPATPKTTSKKKAAKGAKASKKAIAAPAKKAKTAPARDGSKLDQVVAMMSKKAGATLSEIMEATSWQKHTVRGFVAGTLAKKGYTVESSKPEGGERTYKIAK